MLGLVIGVFVVGILTCQQNSEENAASPSCDIETTRSGLEFLPSHHEQRGRQHNEHEEREQVAALEPWPQPPAASTRS